MALQSRGVKKKTYLNCVEVSGINKRLQDRDTWHSCRGKTVQNLILGAEKAKIFKSFFSPSDLTNDSMHAVFMLRDV